MPTPGKQVEGKQYRDQHSKQVAWQSALAQLAAKQQ